MHALLEARVLQWVTGVQTCALPISAGQESACNAGDLGSIPGLGRSSGEGKGYPLLYSVLENSMDRGAWKATVHGISKSQMQLNDFHFHFHVMTGECFSSSYSAWSG